VDQQQYENIVSKVSFSAVSLYELDLVAAIEMAEMVREIAPSTALENQMKLLHAAWELQLVIAPLMKDYKGE
jgi:hypothetical protein